MKNTAAFYCQAVQINRFFRLYMHLRGKWGIAKGASLWRWVSNRGASIPVGTRFSVGKSSVLYLCFRLTRQTLFCGSRTGGFCTDKDEISICTAGKIRLTERIGCQLYLSSQAPKIRRNTKSLMETEVLPVQQWQTSSKKRSGAPNASDLLCCYLHSFFIAE